MTRNVITSVLYFVTLIAAWGCEQQPPSPSPSNPPGKAGPSRTVTVMAAASLAEPFKAIGHAYEAANPGAVVALNFNGSDLLRAQLEKGAAADVFASANVAEMDRVAGKGLVVTDTAKTFANNRLIVIMPKLNPAGVTLLRDLGRPGLKIISANKTVPIYKYTVKMLEAMENDPAFGPGFRDKVLAQVVSYEENVKGVVAKIRLGEGDVGVCYVSDAAAEARNLSTLDVPDAFNQITECRIAVVSKAPQPDDARKFVELVLSPGGQETLRAAGFIPLKP